MKAKEIEIGDRYTARVSKRLTTVRVDCIRANHEGRTVYDVTNLTTRRKTTFRSPQKFKARAPGEHDTANGKNPKIQRISYCRISDA